MIQLTPSKSRLVRNLEHIEEPLTLFENSARMAVHNLNESMRRFWEKSDEEIEEMLNHHGLEGITKIFTAHYTYGGMLNQLLAEGLLSQKNKMCIVWNGSTLSVYLNTWSATIGSPFNMTLAASVSATVSGSMTQRSSYICNRLYQDLSGNPSTWIQSPKFIREAVHPI